MMKTNDLQAELSAMEAKHAEAKTKLAREHAIKSLLPDELDGLKLSVHLHGLYGTTGSVNVTHDFFSYSQEQRQPTLEDVLIVAEAFPPCAVRKIKDGCLSFQLAEFVDKLDEAKKDRWQEEIEVAPYRIKVDGFQQRTMEIEWAAKVGEEVIEFGFTLPLPQWLGTLDIRYKNYMGGKRVEYCQFAPAALFNVMRDGEPLSQLESPIKWGRGSEETPNNFTLYWIDLRNDIASTPADLVRAMIEASTVKQS